MEIINMYNNKMVLSVLVGLLVLGLNGKQDQTGIRKIHKYSRHLADAYNIVARKVDQTKLDAHWKDIAWSGLESFRERYERTGELQSGSEANEIMQHALATAVGGVVYTNEALYYPESMSDAKVNELVSGSARRWMEDPARYMLIISNYTLDGREQYNSVYKWNFFSPVDPEYVREINTVLHDYGYKMTRMTSFITGERKWELRSFQNGQTSPLDLD